METVTDNIFEEAGFFLTDIQKNRFEIYYRYLTEYNEQVNLTAITEKRDVYVKHFLDSISLLKYIDIEQGATMADIGTGAGFPSVPLKIMRPDIKLTLIDSLNKRIVFLDKLAKKLDLEVKTIHQRAEEITNEQREFFDYVVSRAVANLRILSEYDLPYVKCGGIFAAYKGPEAKSEIDESDKTINILGGQILKVHDFELINNDKRNLVIIKKINKTPEIYPRNTKKIINKPI